MEDLQRFRNISIHQILGLSNSGRQVSIRCVFPGHRDNSPSLRIYPGSGYHCFGCDLSGQNAIDFALDVNGCNDKKHATPQEFKKAVDDLRSYL